MPIRRRLSIGVICARRTVCSSLKVSSPQQGLALCVQRPDRQSTESHGNRQLDYDAGLHWGSRVFGHKKIIDGSRVARSVEKIRTCNRRAGGASRMGVKCYPDKCYHWAKNELRKIKSLEMSRTRGLRRGLCVFLPHSPAIFLACLQRNVR